MKHGSVSTYNSGCRCRPCASAMSRHVVAWQKKNRTENRPPPKHDAAGYKNYGCRCEVCTAANAEYQRYYRDPSRTPLGRLRLYPVAALPLVIALNPTEFGRTYSARFGYGIDAYFSLLSAAKARGGFTRRGADQLAVAAGMHPSEIWPDEWFADSMEETA